MFPTFPRRTRITLTDQDHTAYICDQELHRQALASYTTGDSSAALRQHVEPCGTKGPCPHPTTDSILHSMYRIKAYELGQRPLTQEEWQQCVRVIDPA